MQFIKDLLQSPDWVVFTIIVIYTIILVLITWKVTSWVQGMSSWNKMRVTEKEWKSRVNNLEEEIRILKEQFDVPKKPKN